MVSFQSYVSEGKGILYFLKDSLRYRAQILLGIPFYLCVAPGCIIYAYMTEDEKYESISRFRPRLIVYRDDDPKVRNIIKYDENGKRIQLEPRTN